MALAEGTRVFVAYDLPGPELYHERYVLAACQCGQGYHIVLTPDDDIYPEQISLQNADLASFRLGVGGALPAGLTAANTYRFRRLPDAVMMQQYRRDARQAALAMAVVPGGAVMAAPVAALWLSLRLEGRELELMEKKFGFELNPMVRSCEARLWSSTAMRCFMIRSGSCLVQMGPT